MNTKVLVLFFHTPGLKPSPFSSAEELQILRAILSMM